MALRNMQSEPNKEIESERVNIKKGENILIEMEDVMKMNTIHIYVTIVQMKSISVCACFVFGLRFLFCLSLRWTHIIHSLSFYELHKNVNTS